MDRTRVEQMLFAAGFSHTGTSNFGHTYRLDLGNGYVVDGFASVEGVEFFGPPADPNKIERVSCSLEAGGTTYRFYSEDALGANLAGTIAELRHVSRNPDLLKCPECGTRNVHMKEPLSGASKQFKPFLSCDGMQVQGTGKKKGIACYGTSNKLPALINYK
jgi:hypothetical protein